MTVSLDFRPFRTNECWYETYWFEDQPRKYRTTSPACHPGRISVWFRSVRALVRRPTLPADQQQGLLIRFGG
jgi:hypothetical protein